MHVEEPAGRGPPTEGSESPAPRAIQLGVGAVETCVLLDGGQVLCGGGERPFFAPVLSDASTVAAGHLAFCAIHGGAVSRWGHPSAERPSRVEGVAGARLVAVGAQNACAVVGDDRVSCWPLHPDRMEAEPHPHPAAHIDQITAGASHFCSLAGGRVLCWGSNQEGQRGFVDGECADVMSERFGCEAGAPEPVEGLTDVVDVSARGAATCAVTADGRVHCWGTGLLTTEVRRALPPIALEVEGVASVRLGGSMHCLAMQDESIRCWGVDEHGELAAGSDIGPPTEQCRVPEPKPCRWRPIPVVGLRGARALGVGEAHGCALTAAGSVVCWGSNERQQRPGSRGPGPARLWPDR